MALAAILAAVQARVTARLAPATVTYHTGARYLDKRDAGRRVVWVPGRDPYGPPRSQGKAPRAVRTRRAQVLAHCFADDFASAEALVEAVVAACHAEAPGSFEVEFGTWEQPEWLERGELCVLALMFDVPVTAAPDGRVAVHAAPQWDTSASAPGDGALDVGET